jgi:hypothetical protein
MSALDEASSLFGPTDSSSDPFGSIVGGDDEHAAANGLNGSSEQHAQNQVSELFSGGSWDTNDTYDSQQFAKTPSWPNQGAQYGQTASQQQQYTTAPAAGSSGYAPQQAYAPQQVYGTPAYSGALPISFLSRQRSC